mgnify:CR=1 FL=1
MKISIHNDNNNDNDDNDDDDEYGIHGVWLSIIKININS